MKEFWKWFWSITLINEYNWKTTNDWKLKMLGKKLCERKIRTKTSKREFLQ